MFGHSACPLRPTYGDSGVPASRPSSAGCASPCPELACARCAGQDTQLGAMDVFFLYPRGWMSSPPAQGCYLRRFPFAQDSPGVPVPACHLSGDAAPRGGHPAGQALGALRARPHPRGLAGHAGAANRARFPARSRRPRKRQVVGSFPRPHAGRAVGGRAVPCSAGPGRAEPCGAGARRGMRGPGGRAGAPGRRGARGAGRGAGSEWQRSAGQWRRPGAGAGRAGPGGARGLRGGACAAARGAAAGVGARRGETLRGAAGKTRIRIPIPCGGGGGCAGGGGGGRSRSGAPRRKEAQGWPLRVQPGCSCCPRPLAAFPAGAA